MSDACRLTDLPQGCCGIVKEISASGSMRRRLQDIGIIEGTQIECIQKSPLGDPIAYMIRGAVIALREEDSAHIIIQI